MYYLCHWSQDLSLRVRPVQINYNDLTIAPSWLQFIVYSSPFFVFPTSAFNFSSSNPDVHSWVPADLTGDSTASERHGQKGGSSKRLGKSIM